MIVTKEDILKGFIKYAKREIIENITDKQSKMIVATGVKALELYPSLADSIFSNVIFKTLMKCENGKYDLESSVDILKSTMDEYGDFPIQIPFIKNPLVFNKKDIDSLEQCIKESAEDARL